MPEKERKTTFAGIEDREVEFAPLNVDENGDVEVKAVPERAAWGNKWQFMLSCVSLSVGLGNVWRFPYLVQQDGGGAFLIPYVLMMVLEGAPLFLVELGIGQRLRQGSLGVWNIIHPWTAGIGVAATIVSFMVGLYYNMIIAWCFYYFFNSFTSPLPYAFCPTTGPNGTVVPECEMSSETAFFWYRNALDASSAIDEPEGIKWWMALCLLLSWVLVYACIMRGIQSSGKVVYFTALFPYLILIIFFGRAVTLPGAGVGLKHLFTPKMEKLIDPTVWMDAATQVFYSLSVGFGSLIAFASYNPVNNNCKQDAVFMCIVTVFTATFGAVDIFAVLGYKAVQNYHKCIAHNVDKLSVLYPEQFFVNMSAEAYTDMLQHHDFTNETQLEMGLQHCDLTKTLDQAAEGTGLAFIVFTQAIVELPGSNFWSVAFFMMLLALGLGSQFGTMEGVITNMFDMNIRVRKEVLTGVMCIVSFLIGLVFCTGAGEYWLKMFDAFAGTYGLVVIGFFEIVVVTYVYGYEKFCDDIENMTGSRPGMYWQICWRFVAPILIIVIFSATVVTQIMNPPTYTIWNSTLAEPQKVEYPPAVMAVAVLLMLAGTAPIAIVFLMRRFQCVKVDMDIHQAAIKRIDTTTSTTGMVREAEMREYTDTPHNSEENMEDVKFQMEVVDA
ncbi:Sodium-dependent neutral amino acid transporter B(0)AT3 [Amphibalanus amphitrite]|uniref:Sodium-dependent neutral amino acid transporter B(0)AT3 n=1 Tax=Amphibalanus amphitrite TaxID=1232801 RepID=A0A6A4WMK3_AMPAM|nr:Sodium-dependent neutral amino acid transporter B(0)AT3 [Amphibalanus amphitrite]